MACDGGGLPSPCDGGGLTADAADAGSGRDLSRSALIDSGFRLTRVNVNVLLHPPVDMSSAASSSSLGCFPRLSSSSADPPVTALYRLASRCGRRDPLPRDRCRPVRQPPSPSVDAAGSAEPCLAGSTVARGALPPERRASAAVAQISVNRLTALI
ncbi:hypothetical protein E2562_002881 [Oryza meyeriana var. granulata]|uniref:Uncharacterized protein n=1 Tax=Oryza meyeriana var. granulata TaxID=110450 RepID=A0A6G1DDA8_9ORYZ|nr:hypothetical protein E2562_002881 [Oryza meyeriana var. granulata]